MVHLQSCTGRSGLGGTLLLVRCSTLASFAALAALASFLLIRPITHKLNRENPAQSIMLCLLHACLTIITSLMRHRPSLQTLRCKQMQSESWGLDEASKHEDIAADPICKQERCSCAPFGRCASWKVIGRTSPAIFRQDPYCNGLQFERNTKAGKKSV